MQNFRVSVCLLFLAVVYGLSACRSGKAEDEKTEKSVIVMRSTADESKKLFEEQISFSNTESDELPVIIIQPDSTYQEMDGFGFTLTGGSAKHLFLMDSAIRKELLKELFSAQEGIGVSYLRLSLGASDLDEQIFSYHDVKDGETDPELKQFDLGYDRKYLIPVLKEILTIYPELKLMASPWSPPVWMKDNNDTRGGSLLKDHYPAYALYFVKYVQQMAKEGITIDAITVQNEPLHPGNNPSLLMLPEAQAVFIKNHLGPAFESASLKTKIIIYDHNADRPDYPISILNDPEANKYIDGSAFHLYGGEIEAISEVHEAHPDKNLYFTEQWIGAPGDFPDNLSWHTRELIIGATRNWCKTVLEWNLAADENQEPHTDRGGCDRCLGAITIDGNEVTRNPAYYIIAQASKYVRPGGKRIASNIPEQLPNVAFRNTDGSTVVIVLNDGTGSKQFNISLNKQTVQTKLQAGEVATYVL
ncbi:glucosylceramidase [Marivirga sp. S37H4]|uniref:Glucosylceramidase n=1 Tax=Marivirga aurantiaca TaxID=2802615 RepID=A0A935C6A8_9BACT|nr:glycoside hydrolase family 30 beta sandwich domain-containing protein [Marivirga aurantiaca]MBK6264341.1 glucosylceramidase [Marivirga aurantiaca]